MRAGGIEEQDAEGVPGPAVVAEKAIEAGLLDLGLFVNGSDAARQAVFRRFAQTRVVSLGPALRWN